MRKLAVIALTNTRIFLEATLFLTHRCFLTFSWIEPQMLPKCCLLHKVLPKHSVFCIFISMCISRSICFLFLWSVFPLSFPFLLQLPNLIETGKLAFFGHFYLKFSLSMLLSFFLIFGQFQPGVAYKSVAYEKSVYSIIWNICFISKLECPFFYMVLYYLVLKTECLIAHRKQKFIVLTYMIIPLTKPKQVYSHYCCISYISMMPEMIYISLHYYDT